MAATPLPNDRQTFLVIAGIITAVTVIVSKTAFTTVLALALLVPVAYGAILLAGLIFGGAGVVLATAASIFVAAAVILPSLFG